MGPRADRFIVQARPDPIPGPGLAPAERITVRFTGEGAGEAPLSWGQMEQVAVTAASDPHWSVATVPAAPAPLITRG